MKRMFWILALPVIFFGCKDEDETPTEKSKNKTAAQASGGPVFQFVGKGDFAQVYWVDGNIYGSVYVSRGGSANDQQTSLWYYVVQQSPYVIVEEGYGLIPNDDLQGSGEGNLKLNTNTSAGSNPGFTRYSGAGGVITVEWNKTPEFRYKSSGQTQYHFAGFFQHYSGTYEYASAAVTGSVVGSQIGGTLYSAYLGSNHSVQINIERGNQ